MAGLVIIYSRLRIDTNGKCENVTNKENTKNTVVGFKVTPYMKTHNILKQYAQIIFQ
jgi:hypothetical protein